MGKKNKGQGKATKVRPSFENQLKISDLVKELLDKASALPPSNKEQEWENYQDIYKITQKLIALETPVSAGEEDVDQRLARLEELLVWLRQQGGSVQGLKASWHQQFGCGLTCTQQLDRGQKVIEVPKSLMMTLESARSSKLGPLLAGDKLSRTLPQLGLTLHLLEESLQPDSSWGPYIRSLPRQYNTVLYFTPEQLELLRGSPCFDEAIKQCRNIARQYAYYHAVMHFRSEAKSLAMHNSFTYDGYRWAASTVMTRMNNIPSSEDPSQGVPALIPFWDLCNHASGEVSTDFVQGEARSVCYASRDYTAGQQFFIFYGPRPNSEFFLHNGFVYEDNEYDTLSVQLELPSSVGRLEERVQLLQRLGVAAPQGQFHLHKLRQPPVEPQLLTFLRVLKMDQECLVRVGAMDQLPELGAERCTELPAELDASVWQFLHTRLSVLLRKYSDPVEEDDRLLAQPDLSACSQLAVRLRRQEKRILLNTLQYVQQRMSA